MARPTPISGFPEYLPDGRVVEQHVLDTLRRTFELHGFTGVETRSVEPLDQLLRKGETSKEVYVLRRLQEGAADDEEGGESGRGSRLGLHFDLTVPFARYVLENSGRLTFPFRRYQIQKVWRGERPQDGRFREFVQADVDVVAVDDLSYHHEVELPMVIADAFAALAEVGVPPVRILVNNRRVLEGFARGLGLTDTDAVLRAIDKLDKIGPNGVSELLAAQAGASAGQSAALLDLASINGSDQSVVDEVLALAARNQIAESLLEAGCAELAALLDAAAQRAPGVLTADLKIARGLDYYTGSVYEALLVGHEDLGSVCSGGRYDSLASDGTTTYPGVGLSVGVTRLVSRLIGAGLVRATRAVPSAVVVAVTSEEVRSESERVAHALRARGIPVEVAPSAAKLGKQIRHADRRGIPFVWFPATPGAPGGGPAADEVKDIRSGEQVPADPATWEPPAEDWWPRVVPSAPTGGASGA
jgi:histidyl-tRNA synthetase